MGDNTEAPLRLWTPLKVTCSDSKMFYGYLCGASDSSKPSLVLCAIPEEKLICVCGWSVENIEVLADYPPLPSDVKEKLEIVYRTAMTKGKSPQDTAYVKIRKNLILQHFGPLTAKVDDNGNIVLYDGIVTITTPYVPSSCLSTNAAVLQRVKGMLMKVLEQENY